MSRGLCRDTTLILVRRFGRIHEQDMDKARMFGVKCVMQSESSFRYNWIFGGLQRDKDRDSLY